jgi:shikimate kinase
MILKLKRTPGLYVVGFMASGKTTLARMLADHIGWQFADLDQDIESREQQSIPEIWDTRGESEFRRIEHEVMRKRVRAIECGRPMVLALGGGAFVQPQNYAMLENNGVTLWLDCPFHLIERRVQKENGTRPLARDPERMKRIYEERREYYALADFRIDVCSEDPNENLAAVLALPIFH